jgi:hypothetical protein
VRPFEKKELTTKRKKSTFADMKKYKVLFSGDIMWDEKFKTISLFPTIALSFQKEQTEILVGWLSFFCMVAFQKNKNGS